MSTHERWSRAQIQAIYDKPLLNLIYEAATVHRMHHEPTEVQVCTLLSVKTGGCSENCGYCSQSAAHDSGVKPQPLLSLEAVAQAAQKAKQAGSSRFCMGAAWRQVRNNADFDRVLDMVKVVHDEGLEVCVSLGMVTEEQAKRLEQAGLDAYNHNLDTSPEYYDRVVTTRTYQDRLKTLEAIRKTKISVCCGGIIGMGESKEDRIGLLHALSNLEKPPESVPVNTLVPIEGTPMAHQKRISIWEIIRMIATARIIMPKSRVRLSAGRTEMSATEQALCFLAGANSIFAGEKLLTTPNPSVEDDRALFKALGLEGSHGPLIAPTP